MAAEQRQRGQTRRGGRGTREMTLYRLRSGVTVHDILDHLRERVFDLAPDLVLVELPGAAGAVVHASEEPQEPAWCPDLRRTTGLDIRYETVQAGAVLAIEIDGVTYAATYGGGWTWLDDTVKDPFFGLAFAARCVDPDEILDVVRRTPGANGRTDSTMVPGGAPVFRLGIDRYADIVRRLGGRSFDLRLTYTRLRDRPVNVEGAAGIRMHLGLDPADLVADIRAVAGVLATQPIRPELAFVEHIVPVRLPEIVSRLDERLDAMLVEGCAPGEMLSPAVPLGALDRYRDARGFRVRVGTALFPIAPELNLEGLLRKARSHRPGRRLEAVREGHVEMFGSLDGRESLGRTPALHWLEACVSLGSRRFALLDGEWYELGANYLAQLRAEVERLLARSTGTVDLPAWRRKGTGYEEEKDYNNRVADGDRRFLRLDRRLVQSRPGRSSGLEICDLLGPDDALVHVKKASGSAPLSHLFAQGSVSTEALIHQADVRRDFAALVSAHGKGRTVPADFSPQKVVFGILLKDGEELTADTLFPFAQVALVQAARILEGRVDLEVVGIRVE